MNLRKIIALLLSCAIILSVSVPSYALEPAADGTGADETVSTEATEATEATEPTDTEETETTDPTESMEETEATDPTESTEETRSTEPTEGTAETEVTDPADPTEGTDTTDPTDATDATEATEPEADLSADAQSIIDWAGAISWDNQAAADALGRYKDLTADELAAFEQIMGYLYGLKEEYKEKYQAIYEALPAEEQAAMAEAYAAYTAVEAFIGQFEAIAYGVNTTTEDGLADLPVTSGAVGDIFFYIYDTLDGSGNGTGRYVLKLEGTGAIEELSGSTYPWYQYNQKIVKLELSEGITSIPHQAFYGLNISEVALPDSITSIGSAAFYSCTNLQTVTIGSNLQHIAEPFAQGAYRLTSITVSDNNSNFCSVDGVLYNKDMTRLIRYPGALTATEFTVPDTVTSIGQNAFAKANNLRKVVLPEGVEQIDDYAFCLCENLAEINWPNALRTIGISGFYGVPLTSVDLSGTNVVSIANTAFESCSVLSTVYFPTTLAETGRGSFSSCPVLDEVDLSMTALTKISDLCFYKSGVSTVVFPKAITEIGDSAFEQCSNLVEMNLEETAIQVLGDAAFHDCSQYAEPIDFPETLATIGNSTFNGCKEIPSFDFTGCKNFTAMGSSAFQECESIKTIDLSDCYNLSAINKGAFIDCSSLRAVNIPDNIENIYSQAFRACSSLRNINLSHTGITKVDAQVFADCHSLEYVALPKKITSIGRGAFLSCYSLRDIELEQYTYLELIDHEAFKYSNLERIVIPESVERLGEEAFLGCRRLEDVYCLFDHRTGIGEDVFLHCEGNIFVRSDRVKDRIPGALHLNIYISYIVTVPAVLEFNEDATYEINGICAASEEEPGVTFQPDDEVIMMDAYGNSARARVYFGGIHEFRYGKASGYVYVDWPNGAPLGYWKGTFNYSVLTEDTFEELTTYEQDGELNNETEVIFRSSAGEPEYFITVPASLTVDGAAGDVSITGHTAQPVTITCPNTVEMTDALGNKLTANVLMDPVVFPVSLFDKNTVTGSVKTTWDNAPMIGTWTGNFEYTVTVGDN